MFHIVNTYPATLGLMLLSKEAYAHIIGLVEECMFAEASVQLVKYSENPSTIPIKLPKGENRFKSFLESHNITTREGMYELSAQNADDIISVLYENLQKPSGIQYFYEKRCKCCGTIYYRKEIDKATAEACNEDLNLEYSSTEETDIYTISSCCNECATEYYKE